MSYLCKLGCDDRLVCVRSKDYLFCCGAGGGVEGGGRGAGADDNTVATPYILYFVKVVGFCFITFYNGCIGSGLQIQIYPTKCFYIYSYCSPHVINVFVFTALI